MVDREPVGGVQAWTGTDLKTDGSWRLHFDAGDIAEIDTALTALDQRGVDWPDMTQADFPLSALAAKLRAAADILETGRGLVLMSGLPVARYDETARRRLWWGMGLYLGTPVFQDFRGQLMRDITDAHEDTDGLYGHRLTARDGGNFVSSKARTLSNGPLRYHTDRCDVVALFCVHAAQAGGESRVASIAAIHDTILARRPDLLDRLYRPLTRSRLGEEKGGEHQTYDLPVFGVAAGRLTSHYSRTYIEAAQEMPGVAALDDEDWEALDFLVAVADELANEMTLQPGDMQFLNNHACYHARTAFTNPPNGPGRLMHRLWLSMPNSRPLPADHAVLWRDVRAGSLRGGIGQVEV